MKKDSVVKWVYAAGSVVIIYSGVTLLQFFKVMVPLVGDSLVYLTAPDVSDYVLEMPFKAFIVWLFLPMIWALYRGAFLFIPPTVGYILDWWRNRGYRLEFEWGPRK